MENEFTKLKRHCNFFGAKEIIYKAKLTWANKYDYSK